jgi:seryl-tRNA synthetase
MDINIESKKESEIESIEAIIKDLGDKSIEVKIANDNELADATELLKLVKLKMKQIEERRVSLVKPLNDYIKNLNAEFKPFKEKAEEIKKLMESEILRYNKIREERLRIEAEEKRKAELQRLKEEEEKSRLLGKVFDDSNQDVIADALKTQHDKLENKDIVVDAGIKTDDVNTSIRKQWTYEITDENQVPRDYCSPDHYKIQTAIKNGVREVSGIRIYEKEIVVSRG